MRRVSACDRGVARRVAAAALAAWAAACGGTGGGPGEDSAVPAAVRPWFVEITDEVGLDFVYETGATGRIHLPEIVSSGAALFDSDGDGDLDIYLTNGSFVLSPDPPPARPTNRLFRREADGTYADATVESGLGDSGYGIGVAVGDYDNDGRPDVYLSNYGPDRLLRNVGDGRFEDVTAAAGIGVAGFSCSVVFCDYDLDGFLDIYVTQYVRYNPDQYCRDSSGRPDYCNPTAFNPAPDVLLHNEGNGRFTDVSRAAGLHEVAGAGLGVVCEDFDDDGFPDFYAANDLYPNHLWINRGDGRFEDRALLLGAAYNMEGMAEAGMGVVAADLDDDLDLDLFVTHLGGQTNTLYRNLGRGMFEDATGVAGLALSSLSYTSFGVVALDAELDGDRELIVVNGRVYHGSPLPEVRLPARWNELAEPNLFYLNLGGGRFEVRRDLAAPLTTPIEISRSLAMGDIDEDGDLDVLMTNAQGPARLFRNDAPRAGGWLMLRAVDPRYGRRDAIGARLLLTAGGRRQLRTIRRGDSYVSSSDPRAHFGLGEATGPFTVDVRWPDGLEETFEIAGADRAETLVRGQGSQS